MLNRYRSLEYISHPLEVVDRGSEGQLQVGEKLNKAWRVNTDVFKFSFSLRSCA